MKIVKFEEKYADEMASLYKVAYSESDSRRQWSVKKAKESLEVCYKYFSDYCFIALDERGSCMGGIFCLINPYYKGDALFIISVQVRPEFRRKGVGRALVRRVVEKARENGLTRVRFLTDGRRNFPQEWYERLGFRKSGYIEYAADINDVKL